MNKVLKVLEGLIETDEYLKSKHSLNTSIEVFISKGDNERLISQDWEYEIPRELSNNELKCLYTFEGVSIRVDEDLEPDEYKIKINW